ncbi:hypothetical protein PAEAM_56630 [Paenibacillus sp. GM1FR]|uniref:hypothetical protein n=1 Tax=Paenibacillus sp. GM1FR TaxID=2059267 RepID=UPI000C26F286|nr:hypothetical protein [Paenibacillus sp. GM1FR]PJN48801.1 hypothetical protein PAEAM_56630 [Paenibacillus sp. GM1FR]
MRAFHGTTSVNAISIIREGFSLDFFLRGGLGKGIYLSKDVDKCAEYGRHILKVELNEECILKDEFASISSYKPKESYSGFNFDNKFEGYTLSRGFKGLELTTFNEIVIYDLSCITSIETYAIR